MSGICCIISSSLLTVERISNLGTDAKHRLKPSIADQIRQSNFRYHYLHLGLVYSVTTQSALLIVLLCLCKSRPGACKAASASPHSLKPSLLNDHTRHCNNSLKPLSSLCATPFHVSSYCADPFINRSSKLLLIVEIIGVVENRQELKVNFLRKWKTNLI